MVGASGSQSERWGRVTTSALRIAVLRLNVQAPQLAKVGELLQGNAAQGRIANGNTLFELAHRAEDRSNYLFVANHRVKHEVIQATGRPIGVEVVLDECHALAVYGVDQILRFFRADSAGNDAAQFLVARRIEKDAKSIAALAQKIRSASADDNSIPFRSDSPRDLLHHADHAVGVKCLGTVERHLAFITSAPERLGEAVEGAIHSLLAPFHRAAVHVRLLGNLFGKRLIPKLPPESPGKLRRNADAPATIFSFQCDDPEH